MLVEELEVKTEFKQMLADIGVDSLYPPQELAAKAGILSHKNIIICTPTASGKTIASELAIMKALEEGKKAVYIVPLRALAYEKYNEFKKYEQFGYKVRLEVGDLDSSKYKRRPSYDIIVATAEKCDSILRSRPKWFTGTSVLVLDEIHLIATDRGPVYEVLTSKFRNIYPDVQVIGLSATIGNADELAEWLNATLVNSDWRPVELHESVVVKEEESLGDVVKNAVEDGQALVFVNSRRSAEAVAEKLGQQLKLTVEKEKLEKIAGGILDALSSNTKQCRRLAACVKTGTAFHHAGLVNKQRTLIEDSFKNGLLKMISATPTLCLSEDTKIWSGMSEIAVKKIKPGKQVIGLKENKLIIVKTKDIVELLAPKRMVRITTSNYGPILVTENHKMLLNNGSERILVKASECKIGDKIATIGQLKIEDLRQNRWSDFMKDNKLPFNDTEIDESIYYLIGVFLGDGYSGAETQKGEIIYKGSPSIVSEDKDIINKISRICKKFCLHYKIVKNHYGTQHRLRHYPRKKCMAG